MKKLISTIVTLLVLLPATALAEGGYDDSGGCSVGGVLVLFLFVCMLVSITADRR